MGEMVIATCKPKPGKDAEPRALWSRFEAVSDVITLAALPEAAGPFPHFEPLDA